MIRAAASVEPFPDCITFAQAAQALEQARRAVSGETAVVDLSGLRQFDSTAVAVLIALRREHAGPLRFTGADPNLRKLAGLYGVETLLFGPTA